jgi:hypothetical protein
MWGRGARLVVPTTASRARKSPTPRGMRLDSGVCGYCSRVVRRRGRSFGPRPAHTCRTNQAQNAANSVPATHLRFRAGCRPRSHRHHAVYVPDGFSSDSGSRRAWASRISRPVANKPVRTVQRVRASTTTSTGVNPRPKKRPDPWVAYRPVHARRGRQATVPSTSGDRAASWPRAPVEARINARAVLLSHQCSTDSNQSHRQFVRGGPPRCGRRVPRYSETVVDRTTVQTVECST